MQKAFNSSFPKLSTDPVVKLQAVLLTKKLGERARDGTIGTGVVADALGLCGKTVRGWIPHEEEIRQQVVDAGHSIESIAANLPDIDIDSRSKPLPITSYLQSSTKESQTKGHPPNHSILKSQLEAPLKDWVKSRVSQTSIGRIHFMLAVKKVQEWDPNFMPEPDLNNEKAVASYKRRARGWFLRFCRRHNIVLTRTGRSLGGGDRRSHAHDSAFKLKAVLSAREIVENGKGPNGTRGKEQAAREFGISANAIWKWTQKEALFRKDLEKKPKTDLLMESSSLVQSSLYNDADASSVATADSSGIGLLTASTGSPQAADISPFTAVDKPSSSALPSN